MLIDITPPAPNISILTGKQRTCPNCNSPLMEENTIYTKGNSPEKLTDKHISCPNCSYWKTISADPYKTETFNPNREAE